MNKSELIKPFEGVSARTNMLKIMDNPEQLLTKLMNGNSKIGVVNCLCKEIRRNKKKMIKAIIVE